MFCPNCGCSVNETDLYCPQCGVSLQNKIRDCNTITNEEINRNGEKEYDEYEYLLRKKTKLENIFKIVYVIVSIVICWEYYQNNKWYEDTTTLIITCVIFGAVLYAIYGVLAALFGVYGAEKYLKKYLELKKEIGKMEAVKMIELTYHPEKGFTFMKSGLKGTAWGVGSCLQSMIGFVLSIIVIILLMSLF